MSAEPSTPDIAEAMPPTTLRAMRESDLDMVMAIETRAYAFPWTVGIFRDCLNAWVRPWPGRCRHCRRWQR